MSYAAALVGFVYRRGSAVRLTLPSLYFCNTLAAPFPLCTFVTLWQVPDMQGVIVPAECAELVRAACVEDAMERGRR